MMKSNVISSVNVSFDGRRETSEGGGSEKVTDTEALG